MNPINYSFVTSKTLILDEEDGTKTSLDVLVLDKEANDSYWKKIKSFQTTLVKAQAENCEPAYWSMSSAFIDLAVSDLAAETSEDGHCIFGVPVKIYEGDESNCVLITTDERVIPNND